MVVEIPKGWGGGGIILVVKKWKFQGGGGTLHEIPSVVGVWIFSGTTHYSFLCGPNIHSHCHLCEQVMLAHYVSHVELSFL